MMNIWHFLFKFQKVTTLCVGFKNLCVASNLSVILTLPDNSVFTNIQFNFPNANKLLLDMNLVTLQK